VPAVSTPYFNATPLTAQETIKADFSVLGPSPFSDASKGYPIKVGETKSIALGFFSDAPTDDITLDVQEMDPFDFSADPSAAPTNPTLSLSLDKKTGKNGEKANLSVTVNKSNAVGVQLVIVAATIGKTTQVLPIVVGGNKPDAAAQAALQKALDSGMRTFALSAATRLGSAARIASPGSVAGRAAARRGSTGPAAARVFRAPARLPRAI
jgi:hypothetical protein